MDNRIKVLIVDDHAAVRQGLFALVDTAADLVVIGEAEDGLTAVQKARDLQPDVIVMDMVLPNLGGIEAIQAIKQMNPHVRIIVLTNFGEEQHVLSALRSGAEGYLLKDAVMTDIVKAIRDVNDGRLTVHPSMTHVVMQAIR